MQVWPGQAYPLGATYDGAGTNFAVYSEAARRIELCLLHDDGSETAVELREADAFVRHAYLPGVMPGQRYGFRVHGPYEPERGQRCNSAKLLLDPYARAVSGSIDDSWTLILDKAQQERLPVGSAVVQIANELAVGGFSILLSDGEDLALLTGDEGSHLVEPASWEYVVSNHPLAGAPSTSIPPRTIGVLSPCGPTWWRLDTPQHNSKENPA